MQLKIGKKGILSIVVGKAALLVIDMQRDFLSSRILQENPNLISNVQKLIGASRRAGIPVIFTKECHRPGKVDMGSELYPGTGLWSGSDDATTPVHCVEGTAGVEIESSIAPTSAEYVISKRRFNAFLGTELDLLLNALNVQTLLISGVFSEACVLLTALEAHQRDFHVRVIEDCVAGSTPELTEASLKILRSMITGIPINSQLAIPSVEELREPAN